MRDFLKTKWMKVYMMGTFVTATMLSAQPAYAASGTCQTSESWLLKIASLVEDPVKWIMYATGVTTVVFLAYGGLLLRGAKGRQDKVDKAMDFFKYFVGGSFIIFSATGIGTWLMGKFGCTI